MSSTCRSNKVRGTRVIWTGTIRPMMKNVKIARRAGRLINVSAQAASDATRMPAGTFISVINVEFTKYVLMPTSQALAKFPHSSFLGSAKVSPWAKSAADLSDVKTRMKTGANQMTANTASAA